MLKSTDKLSKICLSILSMSILSGTAFGFDNYTKISYLDGVSDSYLYDQSVESSNILNMNSPEAQAIEARIELGASKEPITTSNEKISLSLMDAELGQILRMLCDKAKIGFLPMRPSVSRQRVTLDLANVKLNDAFMMIFQMQDLVYKVENNTLMVYPKRDNEQTADILTSISVLPVKYANVKYVAKFLNSNLFGNGIHGLSNHAVVSANPSKNELFIFGTDDDLAAIKKVLPLIDTKPLVNTFKVNHTTPKEMAELVCESLFSAEFDDKDKNDGKKDDKITIGGSVTACRIDKPSKNASTDNEGNDNRESNLVSLNAPPLTITYFPESGKIGVYGGSVQQAGLIRDFVREHDKKQLMAYVEISVIELNESGSKSFSNTWNLWTPFISLGFDGDAFNVGGAEPFFIWGDSVNSGSTNISRSNNHALTYTLNYIIENGNGRVLSNPKIMVTNGREATIDMTSDYIKKTTTQVLEGSNGLTGGSQREYEIGDDEGIVIKLTPFISPDGYVTMNLTPEFSTVKQTVTRQNEFGGEDIEATLLQRRDLELKNVRIRDGESLVLAGLIKENETQRIKKMPLLSDLPFVGAFFRNSYNTKAREEMVIVVTPHIIKDNAEAAKNEKVYNL